VSYRGRITKQVVVLLCERVSRRRYEAAERSGLTVVWVGAAG
jgi:hypothetical protein